MAVTLSDEQQSAVDRMVKDESPGALLGAMTGVGKTHICVATAIGRNAQTVLVTGPVKPKIVRQWRETFEAQGVTLPFKHITSSTLDAFNDLRANVPGVYYVGREYLGLSRTSLPWEKVKPDLVVADEVQFAANRRSGRSRALRKLNGGYKIASSATPYGNKFEGLWAVCRWIYGDYKHPNVETPEGQEHLAAVCDKAFSRWRNRWCALTFDPYTYDKKRIVGEKEPGAYVKWLPTYIFIASDNVPVEVRTVYVDLHPNQRKLFDAMSSKALAWIDENPLVAQLPIVQRIRLRQITLAEPRVDEEGTVDFAEDAQSSKLDALLKIIFKHHPGQKVVVYMDYAKFVPVTVARLEAEGVRAAGWVGGMPAKVQESIYSGFVDGDTQVLVTSIAAVAEGLDGLQTVCNVEVWLSQSYNEMMNEQARGRVERQGQKADLVYRYYLHARHTDDDDYFESLMNQHLEKKAILR